MKKILIISIIFSVSLFSQIRQSIYGTCDSNHTDLNFLIINFTKIPDTTDNKYKMIDIQSCNIFSDGWKSTKSIFGYSEGVYKAGSNTDFADYEADILYHNEISTITSVDEYMIDLYSNNNDSSYAFIYGDKVFSTPFSLTSSQIDTVNTELGTNLTVTEVSNMKHENAYVVSLNSSNTYGSGYTQAELDYELVFDDGSNVFERIEDTDRSNELVGFRYYCDRNATMYTKFIKPNN
jgi:hypothetical protein